MAYSGTTAASSLANPPAVIAGGVIGRAAHSSQLSTNLAGYKQGGMVWFYSSTNLTTDIVAANFFTEGYYMGMQAGDIVIGNQYSSLGSSIQTFIGSIVSVTTSGAALSTGSLITSTFG